RQTTLLSVLSLVHVRYRLPPVSVSAPLADVRMPQDGQQPCAAVLAIESVEGAIGAQARLLHQVFGLLTTIRQSPCSSIQRVELRQHHRFELPSTGRRLKFQSTTPQHAHEPSSI